MTEQMAVHQVVVVSTTTGSIAEARSIAESLIAQRLAACVQIAAVESIYSWEGAVRHDAEHLLQIKTLAACVTRVEAVIVASHTYELAEILVTPAIGGSAAYFDWVRASVAQYPPDW